MIQVPLSQLKILKREVPVLNKITKNDISAKNSIRSRVIGLVSGFFLLGTLLILITAVVLVHDHMSEQTYVLLKNNAQGVQQRIEQRLRYLVENSKLLSTNEFMVNALIDSDGRRKYLPPLVKNFMDGKDVISVSVVDFDGHPIFKTQDDIPNYKESAELRSSLTFGQISIYVSERPYQMVVIVPIEYYSTSQGALIVVFDLEAIAKRNLPNDPSAYLKLHKDVLPVFVHNFNAEEHYQSFRLQPTKKNTYLKRLGLNLELGLPQAVYSLPIKDAVLRLVVVGIFLIILGIFISIMLSKSITRPILKLYARVKSSDESDKIFCSPIGTDDELEELAKAFDERTIQLQYQAEHDFLTSLPNRILFLDRLKQSIKFARRENSKLAVLFIDLDRFKEVNDSLGHNIGDELLKNVAQKLQNILRSSDTIARLGGDEFTILIDRLENEALVVDIVQKIQSQFQELLVVDKNQLFVSCSIGIALYPVNGTTPDVLLKNADAAMYKAKNEGRNTYQFYTADMTEKAYERVTLETQLRRAIKENQLEVHYQPQIDMRTGNINGMEALIRWRHPEHGLMPPYKFIPIAEETGIIIELDRWVMQNAMLQFADWLKQGVEPGVLSLNLSLLQLNREDFVEVVDNNLKSTGLAAKNVLFEVTETQIMRNPERSCILLQELKNLGVGLAIDDFGTGHSSLAYLKRLPVDKLKIDRSFITDIPADKNDMELTRAIISMARSLNINIIAEGVETEDQIKFLVNNNCYEAQGYHYYKPVSAKHLWQILNDSKEKLLN